MPPLLHMYWRDVLFAHWPVEPAIVDEALPEQLTVDTFDGSAYLGVVPFEMAGVRPAFSPISRSFPELNLRTYVRVNDTPGVYFFSLDAADRLGVTIARRAFSLPYHRARMSMDRTDGEIRFQSQRRGQGKPVQFDATYRRAGDLNRVPPDSLAAFLTERYRFYAPTGERVLYGQVAHDPWRLAPAEVTVRENDLFAANGFDHPESDPLFHYSPGCAVTAGRPRRVADVTPSKSRDRVPA